MKLNKFVSIGLVVAVTVLTQPAFAGSSSNEDFVQSQGSCMVLVSDSKNTRMVNVEYIRAVQVENDEPNTLNISLASNYNNGLIGINIKYPSSAEAVKALQDLSDRINDCQYNAKKKHKM